MKLAKLISIILALTLVFGACAVGFTAFAADDGSDGTTEEVPVGNTDDGSENPPDEPPVDTPDDTPDDGEETEEEQPEGFLARFFSKLIDKTVRLYNFLMVPIRIIFAGIPMINIDIS